jgi:hypothetical protein
MVSGCWRLFSLLMAHPARQLHFWVPLSANPAGLAVASHAGLFLSAPPGSKDNAAVPDRTRELILVSGNGCLCSWWNSRPDRIDPSYAEGPLGVWDHRGMRFTNKSLEVKSLIFTLISLLTSESGFPMSLRLSRTTCNKLQASWWDVVSASPRHYGGILPLNWWAQKHQLRQLDKV